MKKTITDNAKDFEVQYDIAKIIIFKYLDIWFKQTFSTPKWKEIFADKPEMSTTLAVEVMRYLLALEDKREISDDETLLAKKHAKKWADDVMNMDKGFCHFVVQTLRMESIFNRLSKGSDWLFKDPRGKKVFELVMKYGGKVEESPNPKKYNKLIKKWMSWSDIVDKKKDKN